MIRKVYGVLAHVGDGWLLAKLEPHVVIKLKALFTNIPKAAGSPFKFKDTPDRCADLLWFESRYPLGMSVEDRQRLEAGAKRWRVTAAELERIKEHAYEVPAFVGLQPGQEVWPHQAAAAAILQRVHGLLVGDDTGEGKTYTAGGCLLLPSALPGLVVRQPHLRKQWAQKLREFTTLSVHQVEGTRPYAIPPVDVRVIGYTQLQGWVDVLCHNRLGLVAWDETQELRRGEETEKGKAAARIANRARMRLGLTATPVYNYGGEIHQVMRYIRPEVLGPREDFIREWCTSHKSKWIVKEPKALGSYLRDQNAFVRKEKDRAGKPAILMQRVQHDEGVLASIEDVARQLAETAASGSFHERGEATRELDMRVREATGVAKAPFVAQAVRVLVTAGQPMILFGWHRAVYEIWLDMLADLEPAMFTGSETPAKKEKEKQRFLDGDTDLVIMSLRSGAGVDGLQKRASLVGFGELDWSPQIHHQGIGRVDREGQACWPEPVTAIYFYTEDGSDPSIMEVHGVKASQGRYIVNPHLKATEVSNDGSRLRSLVERYRARGAA